MNRKSLIAAAVLAAAGASSFAIEGEQLEAPSASSLTREEVKAELREHVAAGAWVAMNEASPGPLQAAEWDRRIAQLQSARTVAQAAEQDQLMALANRSQEAEVIILEVVPADSVSADQQAIDNSSLPFAHPAIYEVK